MQDTTELLKSMAGRNIMVVGDLMLDTFVYGDVDRISPESPVPILTVRDENIMLGGAGNVVANLCALNVTPYIFAVTGNDAAAEQIESIACSMGANTDGLVRDASRPTTLKTRYLARGQQLLRTDIEKTHPLPDAIAQKMFASIEEVLKSVQAVVLSDYGKGMLGKELLHKIITAAKKTGVPVLVDPKGNDFSIYRGADIVTPNRKELADAAGLKNLKSDEEIVTAAQKIIAECGIKLVVATRSEDGMSIIGQDSPVHLVTKAREVFDVSGAGDTVIATLAAVLAAGGDITQAATLANIAAGIAVSKIGTSPVRTAEIESALTTSPSSFQATFADWNGAAEQVRKWKTQGLKVGMTCGCFDIIHFGHVNYLAQARGACDRLVVALNHDASVKILKGPTRPVNDETARAGVIGSLGSVDLVVLFGADTAGADNTPSAIIETLRPDIFFKGGDYTEDQLPEAKIIRGYGGDISIMKMHDGYSTTSIIEKSRKNA